MSQRTQSTCWAHPRHALLRMRTDGIPSTAQYSKLKYICVYVTLYYYWHASLNDGRQAAAGAQVAGGGQMQLRSSDPLFLSLVDAWWRQLLPRLAPLTYSRGGPIVLVQVRFNVIPCC